MNIEEVKARVDEDFDIPAIQKREAQIARQVSQEVPAPQPIDLYQRNRNRIRDVNAKSFPRGSSAIVNLATRAVIDGEGGEGLARAHKRVKDDSESLRARGERGRAELLERQYMEEHFLPAIEVVINASSPDEVLNSKNALRELDKYALPVGSGYTATYIRQAYANQLGQKEGQSDSSVRDDIRQINSLLDNGELRMAYSMADRLKKKIDEGRAMADEIDYEFLGRVASYFG